MTLTTINRFFRPFGFVLVVGWTNGPGPTYFWFERISSYNKRVREAKAKAI